MSNTPDLRPCGNCHKDIPVGTTYCQHCGQKNTDGRISIVTFFSVFFSTVFNLESKFFQTMKDIFIPGKLTTEYFKGKRKRYFHPVRLFIVSALLLVAAISWHTNTEIGIGNVIKKKAIKELHHKELFADLDSVTHVTLQKFPDEDRLPEVFDSVKASLRSRYKLNLDSVDISRYITIGFFGEDFNNKDIATEDFVHLTPEEIADKYGVEGLYNRLFFKQKIKLLKDQGSFVTFLLGNALWVILAMMPFLALVLKLLYIRHGYYYVEHLIFSFHAHSFAFVVLILSTILNAWLDTSIVTLIVILWLFFYLYKAMRRVYMQGRVKTFVKLLVVNAIYFVLFILFVLGGLMLGIALF